MPALNFKQRFAASIEDGDKTTTIRALRKRPIQVGDTLYLYIGMRTRQCLMLDMVKAVEVLPIYIDEDTVNLALRTLPTHEVCALARREGFGSIGEFRGFFRETHGLPFTGQYIAWGDHTLHDEFNSAAETRANG